MAGKEHQLAAELVKVLARCGQTMAAAESLTGGLIGATVTATPGASTVFSGSAVTYSADAKRRILGVSATSIAEHTVFSEQVAAQMANGARTAFSVDLAVAVTGVAGPGPYEGIPSGTVCFAWSTAAGVSTETRALTGDRDTIRRHTVVIALQGVIDRALRH